MSDSEIKEGFSLVLAELRDMRQKLTDLQSSVDGIRVAVVEHTRDEETRFEHFSEALSGHSKRLKELESAVSTRLNGGG